MTLSCLVPANGIKRQTTLFFGRALERVFNSKDIFRYRKVRVSFSRFHFQPFRAIIESSLPFDRIIFSPDSDSLKFDESGCDQIKIRSQFFLQGGKTQRGRTVKKPKTKLSVLHQWQILGKTESPLPLSLQGKG